ncbi:hypothetical protein LJC45_03135 [Alistipes sp. OttesenSCG-928-B03]|nr:hypothetical protein [Alistipes sp. OttesenSCG-928-B03]
MSWFRKSKTQKLKRDILKEDIDYGNIIISAFHAKSLYDELKVKYHPDRFYDKEMIAKANVIFQRITENKENFEMLTQLKELAESELTINDN